MIKHSRFLSLILRHKPEAGGITLDEEGWAKVEDVLEALRIHVSPLTREQLDELVETNDKKRFAFSEFRDRIRANQGHSLSQVNLALEPQTAPPFLYHGTKRDFLDSIMRQGLKAGQRQHVHLSTDEDTAKSVAKRRQGDSIILKIDTSRAAGPFFLSQNGVWLTAHVAPEAICEIDWMKSQK